VRVASFHLVRAQPGAARAARALAHLATDRPRLARVEGLEFHRLLGTGAGARTDLSVDPRRTAVFAVWADEAALDRFLASSVIAQRWADAEEAYTVRLRGLGAHGTWGGHDVLAGLVPGSPGGPIAVLTRASVRLARWPRFHRAARGLSAPAAGADGLLAVVGVGEAPVVRQATFSLWRSAGAVAAFARALPEHVAVVRRTRAEGWYGEELFARFEPYASSGSWGGRDPLA
jgi:heme-degrading monooxygenase HmoA